MSKWITPRLDWQPYDFVKYGDINRIMGNCNFLFEHEPQFVSALPENYTVASYLYESDWTALLAALREMSITYALFDPQDITTDAAYWTEMTAQNFYNVEKLEKDILYMKTYKHQHHYVSEHTLLDSNFNTGGF